MYYLTYNKHAIYPNKIKSKDICLDDIAHHLTNINRYGGALPLGVTYSVAQHSIALAEYVYEKTHDKQFAAAALLHDASEAYLGDIVSGLKPLLKDYCRLEDRVQNLIYRKYKVKLPKVCYSVLRDFDKRMVLDEVMALMPNRYEDYKKAINKEPLFVDIPRANSLQCVKDFFLDKCEEYGILEGG